MAKNVGDRFFNDDTRENASKMHKEVWSAVRKRLPQWGWLQEQPIKMDSGATLFVDIMCKTPIKIAIEVMGEQHNRFSQFFHTSVNDFKKSQQRDAAKKEWLLENGFNYITFYTNEKLTEELIIKRILDEMSEKNG